MPTPDRFEMPTFRFVIVALLLLPTAAFAAEACPELSTLQKAAGYVSWA
jgi:hypothetical protein